jgi:hypothetical protein
LFAFQQVPQQLLAMQHAYYPLQTQPSLQRNPLGAARQGLLGFVMPATPLVKLEPLLGLLGLLLLGQRLRE